MLAFRLDPDKGKVYRDQAVYQLRTYTDTFLVSETGLAKTILLKEGLGKTYWTRATGWLLWAITAVLRHLSPSHPDFGRFRDDLQALAAGVARVQDVSGGLHVLLDDPSTPLETTGTAMCAMTLHESVRRGWLPDTVSETVARAWNYVKGNIAADGNIRNVYTGWAVPAENRSIGSRMDTEMMEWVLGLILSAANEVTSTGRSI
jgi:rhamnogalacturonyl hydrolase YesR